jgi:class 3 adenylate cyclase/tetratricopeptide (TPR) repeat protein
MIPEASEAMADAGGRRHNLAILFCDLCNSTGLGRSISTDPEIYADLILSVRKIVREIVARHGGEVVRVDGDGVLCIFGYPECHEDAGRRAGEAAIDAHAAVAALNRRFAGRSVPLRLHSGIHMGLVLLREGDIECGRYEMLCDTTNVAAGLCKQSGSDEILVSEATLGADRHFFRLGPRRRIWVGKDGDRQLLTAFNIYGREPVTTRFAARLRQGVTPFAGRMAELARLRAWLADAQAGPMLVAGPPGIGKSRLLGEFLAEAAAAGVAVHRGYCEAYLGARPLQPFAQLAQSISGDPAAALSDSAPGTAPGAAAGAGLAQAIEAMRALLGRAAAAGPCILAIDDWQWADGASREMFDALAPAAGRIRFLLASREPGVGLHIPEPIETIELPPLSAEEARAAIAALLPTPDPFLASRIGEESGGSPLFLEELCHASLRGAGEAGGTERHGWLDMLIQARFAQLQPEQAMLVRAASVIGHMVPTWLFATVTGVEPGDPAMARLADADFLFPGDVGGTLRFKHGITRDAIYRTIGRKERQALHRRVVEAIRREAESSGEQPLLDALAYHYAAGGDTAQAVPYAIRAGDAALAAGALDRAQAHYRTAFESVAAEGDGGPLGHQIWPLFNKYGLACIVDPAPDQLPVMREMARRLRTLDNAEALVRSEYWIGAIAYGLGEGKQSVVHLAHALRAAIELGQTRFIPQIEIKLAQSLFAAGRYQEADALFTRLLPAMGEQPGRADHETYVYAWCCHGFLHADQGDFTAAEACYAAADQVRGSGTPPLLASYLTQKSAVCLFRGEWAEALALARRCLEACGRARARYQAMMSKALAAYAQWQIDRDPEAVETLVGAARWFGSGASQQRTSLLLGWLTEIMVETGRADFARHFAARAITRARRTGDRLGEAMTYRALARLAARRGDACSANRYLVAAYRSAAIRASPREEAQTRLCEAELAMAAGERDRAGPPLEAARAAFAAMDMPRFAEQARAMLAPDDARRPAAGP